MFNHYLKISLRSLWKNRLYVIINALGLGVSLACCMAAYLWVAYDLEFDDFHDDEKVASVYKVHSHWTIPDVGQNILSPYALAPTAYGDLSGISRFTRYSFEKGHVQFDQNTKEGIAFADSSFIEMFDFQVTDGALSSFKQEQYAVISEKLSKKIFGNKKAIGQVVNVKLSRKESFSVVVGAVIKNIPHNGSFTFEMLVRIEQFAEVNSIGNNDWSVWPACSTFFEIPEKDQVSAITEQLQSYIALEEGDHSALTLEPFKADYTMSEIEGAMVNVRMWQAPILVLALTALMIFLIACFNLANTSYALSIRRVREIGIRRILGAHKTQIFALFFLETILIIMLAMIIGLSVAQYIVPSFAEMWADGISNRWDRLIFGVKDIHGINLLIFLMLITFFGVAAAGSFPAFFHGSASSTLSLKGKSRTHGFNSFSQALLVLQFSLAVLVIISAVVFINNSDYMHEGDIGFDRDKTMFVEVENSEDLTVFSKVVQRIAGVSLTSRSQDQIGISLNIREVELGMEKIQTKFFEVSENYFPTLGMRLTTGRFLLSSDDNAIVITERLRELLNLDDPMGNRLKIGDEYYSIVGIIEDVVDKWWVWDEFNRMPMVFKLSPHEEAGHFLTIRTDNYNSDRVYAEVRNAWNRLYPSKPFTGNTHLGVLESGRASNLKSAFIFLALMTVLISCTGTYALVRLNIEKRLHEMAIRKVFGADITVLFKLLNREIALILLMASVLGGTIAYNLFHMINAGGYKILFVDITLYPFLSTIIGIIFTGLLMSCLIIYKHAHRNPVSVLRNE